MFSRLHAGEHQAAGKNTYRRVLTIVNNNGSIPNTSGRLAMRSLFVQFVRVPAPTIRQ
jgi:hypothetical protein